MVLNQLIDYILGTEIYSTTDSDPGSKFNQEMNNDGYKNQL